MKTKDGIGNEGVIGTEVSARKRLSGTGDTQFTRCLQERCRLLFFRQKAYQFGGVVCVGTETRNPSN